MVVMRVSVAGPQECEVFHVGAKAERGGDLT
jgi:hypothetical protein